jgi:hypothetical protein
MAPLCRVLVRRPVPKQPSRHTSACASGRGQRQPNALKFGKLGRTARYATYKGHHETVNLSPIAANLRVVHAHPGRQRRCFRRRRDRHPGSRPISPKPVAATAGSAVRSSAMPRGRLAPMRGGSGVVRSPGADRSSAVLLTTWPRHPGARGGQHRWPVGRRDGVGVLRVGVRVRGHAPEPGRYHTVGRARHVRRERWGHLGMRVGVRSTGAAGSTGARLLFKFEMKQTRPCRRHQNPRSRPPRRPRGPAMRSACARCARRRRLLAAAMCVGYGYRALA